MKFSLPYLTGMIDEVPPEAWRDLFEKVGYPASLSGAPEALTTEGILAALRDDEPSDELLEALDAIDTLGTDAGRQAIETALADQHILPNVLPGDEGDRVFALRLFLAKLGDVALAGVFARAEIQAQQAAGSRAVNEFVGKEPRRVAPPKKKKVAGLLEQATVQYCLERQLGAYVRLQAIEDDDVWIFRIVRGHHLRRPLTVLEGRAAHAPMAYRQAHIDILRYDMVSGQLRIIAGVASVVEFYRRTLGLVLFDDPSFFDGEPLYSLQVLQDKGSQGLLDHGVAGVGQVWLTECLWEHGDRDRLHLRSPDCFAKIDKLRLTRSEGTFVLAKLKMQAAGKSTRPVTVTIRTPSRIEVRPKWQEPLAKQYLAAIGVRNPPSAQRPDLWSMSPWRQSEAIWLGLFGNAVGSLVASGALVATRLASVPHPDHAGAGNVLDAQQLPDGDIYGVSDAEEIPSRSLSPTELDGFELRPEALRQHIRTLLGITTGGSAWNEDGLLHLGFIDLGGPRLYVAFALRPLAAGIGARLRTVTSGAPSVVLVPTARCDNSELATVTLDLPLPERATVIRAAVAACGLRDRVAALYSAPDGARLIVDKVRGQIWLDGIVVQGLTLGTQPFRFVELLARRCPSFVTAGDLCDGLSVGRKDLDQVVRSARSAAIKAMKTALTTAGKSFESPFQTARKSHRCALLSHVLDPVDGADEEEGAEGALERSPKSARG
ncbi:MAG: hypothetical protein AB7H96_11945 [Vicinamibacterales bacterium]